VPHKRLMPRDDVHVPPDHLQALIAFGEVLELLLMLTTPGSPVYLSRPRQASNFNRGANTTRAYLQELSAAMEEVRRRPPAADAGKGVNGEH
jgi:hypothetical protein